ncbi:MAG: hypothetical protein HQL89_09405 [Magnetococcales bacterium]|nr:hypothetical protein [Magnetococcales bacterium]
METIGLTELEEPLMASLYGGPIAVRMQHNVAVPEAALFRLRLNADMPPGWPSMRLAGEVHLQAEPRSFLERLIRATLLVLVREWEM